jgi:hypothetical protein
VQQERAGWNPPGSFFPPTARYRYNRNNILTSLSIAPRPDSKETRICVIIDGCLGAIPASYLLRLAEHLPTVSVELPETTRARNATLRRAASSQE